MKLNLPPGPFRAYLFDCDGTIADYMPLHYIAWSKALGEWDAAVLGLDELDNFGNGLEFGEEREVEILFVLGEGLRGHVEALHLVEVGYDIDRGLAAPGVEELFIEGAAVFAERLAPGDVVEGHGVGDRAVTVEEIGAEWARGQVQVHAWLELLY